MPRKSRSAYRPTFAPGGIMSIPSPAAARMSAELREAADMVEGLPDELAQALERFGVVGRVTACVRAAATAASAVQSGQVTIRVDRVLAALIRSVQRRTGR